MDEIKQRLDSLSKKFSLVEKAEISDFYEIFEIYDTVIRLYVPQLRTYSGQIIRTLLRIFECATSSTIEIINGEEDVKKKIVDTINNLATSCEERDTGEKALVYFLYILNERKKLYEERDILNNYGEYIDSLESLSWLFRIEYDGNLAYPIGDLLSSSILEDFIPDEDHLIYLIASLQLFGNLYEIPTETRETILKYSAQYNLKILELLCNGGKVLLGSDRKKNMEQNSIIIAQKGNTILVRTTDMLREEVLEHPYDYETNANETPIAKFFVFTLGPREKLCSLDEFFEMGSADECRKLFIQAISDGAYNIFMNDSIVYDEGSRCFVKWLNPLVSKDKTIISDVMGDNYVQGNTERAFFNTLGCHRSNNWCRPTVLAQKGIDILTLDFLICFHLSVSEKLQICATSFIPSALENWEVEGKNFAQNYIIQQFFKQAFITKKNITPAIKNYCAFINAHYNSEGEIDHSTRLVMPYKFYIPFQNCTDLLLEYIGNTSLCKENFEAVDVEKKVGHQWTINKKESKYSVVDIVSQEVVSARSMTSAKYKGLLDADAGIVYVLSSATDKAALNSFNELCDFYETPLISMQLAESGSLRLDDLYRIIYHIGISHSVTRFFWPVDDPTRLSIKQLSPLMLYKILHHICFYEIHDKIPQWNNLIFQCHLSEPCDREAAMYRAFREKIHSISSLDGCLLISKQQHADKSTLEAILNYQRSRDFVDVSFDAQALNARIEKKNQKYYFKPKGEEPYKIKRIIFLTDNIISGTSTKQMLLFHLGGQHKNAESIKRGYITLDADKTIQKIIEVNSPKIEIQVAFWFGVIGDEEIKETDEHVPCFDIALPNGQKHTISIHAQRTYAKNTCTYTQNAYDLAMAIYKPNASDEYKLDAPTDHDRRHLLFRFNNMPNFYVFPKEVMDTRKKIGLFEHRRENI